MTKIKRKKLKRKDNLKEKRDLMEYYLCKGISVKDASLLSGVTKKQLLEMRSNFDFEELYQKCLANYELEHLENVSRAGKAGAWQASAFILERQFPDKYAKKDIVKHEYEVKFMTFQKVILEVINNAAPQLKNEIVKKLRQVDTGSVKLIGHDQNSDGETLEAEFVE